MKVATGVMNWDSGLKLSAGVIIEQSSNGNGGAINIGDKKLFCVNNLVKEAISQNQNAKRRLEDAHHSGNLDFPRPKVYRMNYLPANRDKKEICVPEGPNSCNDLFLLLENPSNNKLTVKLYKPKSMLIAQTAPGYYSNGGFTAALNIWAYGKFAFTIINQETEEERYFQVNIKYGNVCIYRVAYITDDGMVDRSTYNTRVQTVNVFDMVMKAEAQEQDFYDRINNLAVVA